MPKKRKYTKPLQDGCGRTHETTMDGTEYFCDYNPDFECDKCMYIYQQQGINNRGLNPQSKKHYDRA